MNIHTTPPEDWSEMLTINTFGDPDYQVLPHLEDRGITEIWVWYQDGERLISYKKKIVPNDSIE